MARSPRLALVALLLLPAACDEVTDVSDADQYGLKVGLEDRLGPAPPHVLVDSVFGLEVLEVYVDGEVLDGDAATCVTTSASGGVTQLDASSFQVVDAGPGAVELADPADTCAPGEPVAALGPDRWSLTGVDPSEVVGRWAHTSDDLLLDYHLSPGPLGRFPDVMGRPLDELLVVSDSPFLAEPALVLAADDTVEVRFRDDARELVVPAHYDHLRPTSEDSDGNVKRATYLAGSLAPTDAFDSSIDVLGSSFALPTVRSVPVERVASLELVPVYGRGNAEREWGQPAGVVAVARDSEGRRMFGAPVEFELTRGRLAMDRLDPEVADTVFVVDHCREAPGAPTLRGATIEATVGDLQTSVDLDWIALPDDESDPEDPLCTGGACSCSSARPPGESALALLALLGLGLGLRRRRS